MSENLYAAPDAQILTSPTSEGPWADGAEVYARRNTPFPPRCVRCNAPGTHKHRQKLYWHHPAVYLTLLLNVFVYVLVALFTRKSSEHDLTLCDTHMLHRRLYIATAVLGGPLFFFGTFVLVTLDYVGAGMLFGFVGLITFFVAVFRIAPIRAKKIDAEFVSLVGAHLDFVRSLPPR